MKDVTIFESDEKLAEEVARGISVGQAVRIGIDGKDGSGKTTLAQRIAEQIKGKVVSLDEYVEKNKGGYVPYLRVEEIRATLSSETGPLVVEGVCLLAPAERIGVTIDKLIYVKRMNSYRLWLDEEECDPKEPVEDLIEKLEKNLGIFEESEASETVQLRELVKEIVRYHAEYQPSKQADYIFHRIDA